MLSGYTHRKVFDTYTFSPGSLQLHAHTRQPPPHRASTAEDQPMYKPSPISYLGHSDIEQNDPICVMLSFKSNRVCMLTLSQGRNRQRTPAWCWLHTKTQQSWYTYLEKAHNMTTLTSLLFVLYTAWPILTLTFDKKRLLYIRVPITLWTGHPLFR